MTKTESVEMGEGSLSQRKLSLSRLRDFEEKRQLPYVVTRHIERWTTPG